jgi:dihydrofolate reductase
MIKVVAAVGRSRELGKDNSLLWRLPNDLRNFKSMTTGGVVVMGRKTFESIGRPLPGRRNIVITRNSDFCHDGVEVVYGFDKAMEACHWDCFVIGGAEIYEQALPLAQRLYLTLVDGDFEADTFFPSCEGQWLEVTHRSFEADAENEFAHEFVEYERPKF